MPDRVPDADPMNDDDAPLSAELQDAAAAYHAPPPAPREAMWRAIEAARRRGATPVEPLHRPRPVRRYVRWGAAAAAVLALGIGLGRLSRGPRTSELTSAPAPVARPVRGLAAGTREPAAYRVAAAEHLAQAEVFLTLFRASVRNGPQDRLASGTARELLASNRLLLDSPAGADARLKLLLEDLELVLAQIAQLSPERGGEDRDLINDGLEHGGVLPRLRAAVPAGGSFSLRQGAL